MEPISDGYKARFAEGAKSTSLSKIYKTQREWEVRGLTNFKRRVLGFCGRQSVKSIDELARILTELKVIDSAEEGRQFIEGLYGTDADYGNGTLKFTRVQNNNGQEACRINRSDYLVCDG